MLKVKEVAELVGVSVRTLHHYDKIGLLHVQKDDQSGYRVYGQMDLEKLQQIMFFKELGFDLKAIKSIIDDPSYDKVHGLEMQHEMLLLKKKRLEGIIESIEKTIESEKLGDVKKMDNKNFKIFNEDEIEKYRDQYKDEVEAKYSKEAVAESREKTSKYSKEDWSKVLREGNEIFEKIAELMDLGPDNAQVQMLLDDYRDYITRSFYKCSVEVFQGLGQMYVADPRFTKNIDKAKDGLAVFISEGIKIYAANHKD